MDKQRLSSLDACRGIAILMVVCFHVSVIWPSVSWINHLAKLGNLGVQLFFLVSAVTMCYMWERRRAEPARQMRFYVRRAARIAPLFWFAIIFYTLLWGTAPSPRASEGIGLLQLALTALFLHPFAPSAVNSVVPGGWSIGIEMGFYAIFPFLAAVQPQRLLTWAFAAYLSIGILGTTLAEHFGSGEGFATFLYYSMLTQLPIFPLGMFIHAVTLGRRTVALRHTLAIAALWIATAFAAKLLLGLTSRPVFWMQIALLALLVWSALHWGIGQRALAWLGRLSYSMYLFHFAVLYGLEQLFGTAWPYSVGLAATLLATVAIALLSQRTAEKWSQEVGRRVISALTETAPERQKALLVPLEARGGQRDGE